MDKRLILAFGLLCVSFSTLAGGLGGGGGIGGLPSKMTITDGTITGVTISGLDSPLPIADGGTASTTAAAARTALSAAASGVNADITQITGLTAGIPIQATYTDAGAVLGPTISLERVSASPATSDAIGAIRFYGTDSGASTQEYARLSSTIYDPSAASEDGIFNIEVVKAGVMYPAYTYTLAVSPPQTILDGMVRSSTDNTQDLGSAAAQWNDVYMGGNLISSKACAAGYTRAGANYCARSTDLSRTALVLDTCTTVTAPSATATAVQVSVQSFHYNHAPTAPLRRFTLTKAWNDSATCAGVATLSNESADYDDGSSGGGASLGAGTGELTFALSSVGASYYLKYTDDSSNTQLVEYGVVGYWDMGP